MNIDFDNDERLNILNVAYLCNLSNLKKEGCRYTTDCPFCGAKPGHFYLTPRDPHKPRYKNVYRCVKCGESGSQVKLYYNLHNCTSTKEAFKEIIGINEVKSSVKNCIHKANQASLITQNKLASIEIRDKTYRELINRLRLSEMHYSNLLNRGLSIDQIRKNGYVTLPSNYLLKTKICNELLGLGLDLVGVPGFFLNNKKQWTFWTPKEGGFLVPVLDIYGRIQGCQIRKNVTSKKKYPWFSSSYMENGTGTKGFIHVHWNMDHTAKKVVITEGPLKATVSSILSDTTFLGIPGVGSFRGVASILKQIGAKKINIAYDMDMYTNPQVLDALKKFLVYLKSEGYYDLKVCSWNKQFKGIDDYLYHLFNQKNYRKRCVGIS